jgi:hypothetical protein
MCRAAAWSGPPAGPVSRPAPSGWPGDRLPADPTTRVDDRQRQQVADDLRAHFTAGRLDIDEFSTRLGEALRAGTAGELRALLSDLPPTGVMAPVPPPAPSGGGWRRAVARAHVRTYLTVAGILILVWALTGPHGYFWPAWPLALWGWLVFLHARSHAHTRRRSRGRSPDVGRSSWG